MQGDKGATPGESQLIVITGYPEVFEGNRRMYKVIRHNELNYFYRDHIEGQPDEILLS